MKKQLLFFSSLLMFLSCGEKLIEKPDNLIPREKMVQVLKDLAIVNAAKSGGIEILKSNDVVPTEYIFKKHNIDSAQFVDSDRYYASLPLEYESIYVEIEAILLEQKTVMEKEKKVNDSLKKATKKTTKNPVKKSLKNVKLDSTKRVQE